MAAAEASYNEQVDAASKTAAGLIGAASAAYAAAMDAADAAYEKAFDGPAAAYEAKAARAAEEYAASMKSAEDSYRTDTDNAYQAYLSATGPAAAKASQAEADADKALVAAYWPAYAKFMELMYTEPVAAEDGFRGAMVNAIIAWVSAVRGAWQAYDAVEAPAYEAYCKAFDAAGDSYDGKAAAAGKAYAESLGSAQSEYEEAVKGIAAGAQATWEAAAQAAWSTYATEYNAAAAAYNGSLAAAAAGYNSTADTAAATLSAVATAAGTAAQAMLDSAREGWIRAEESAWTACVGAASAADAGWLAAEQGAWESYLGADNATTTQAGTAAKDVNSECVVAATKPKGDDKPNVQDRRWFPRTCDDPRKAMIQKERNIPPVSRIEGAPNPGVTTKTQQGHGTHYTAIPKGTMVGTSGCGPCIGVIIQGPEGKDGSRQAWVYHFDAKDNPGATLRRDGPFPKGSRYVLFGGMNHDPHSMGTLDSIWNELKNRTGIGCDGMFNASGLWIDSDGNYHTHDTDQRPPSDDDGTHPRPKNPEDR